MIHSLVTGVSALAVVSMLAFSACAQQATTQATNEENALEGRITDVNVDDFNGEAAQQVPVAAASAAVQVEGDGLTLLHQALTQAYNTNPQLEAQRQAQEALNERVPQALSGALPTVQAEYQEGRRRVRFGTPSWTNTDSITKTITMNQPLFRGGQTWANTKSARRQVEAGQYRLQQVEQDVLFNTVSAYMDVVESQSILELSNKNYSVLDKQLEASSQRFEVGEDTRTDVAQSEARRSQARSDVIESESRLETTRAVFERLVGSVYDRFTMPDKLPETPASLDAFITEAMEQNPALLERERVKESADYVVNSNIGTLLPEVSLQGSMSRQEGAGVFGNSAFDQDDIGLRVSLPLYQGGARYSRIREAKESYQQRRFEALDQSNIVRQQAIAAWQELQAAKATLISNQDAIDAASIALEGVRQEQQYGARTTLDVLDAERELFNTRVNYVRSQRAEVVATYRVLSVIGKLTAQHLGLNVEYYDPQEALEDVEYQFIGF